MARRLPNVPPVLVDIGLAVVVTAFVVLSLVGERRHGEHVPTSGVLVLLGLLPALALRRLLPGTALVLVVGVQIGLALTRTAPGANVPAELIVPYSVAAYAGRRVRLASGVAAGAALVATALPWAPAGTRLDLLGLLLGGAGAWLVGAVLRGRRDRVVRLAEHAERVERERDLQARRAVADERLRIARELHDVVAHNLSVVVVQAQALRPVVDRDPERALSLASSIEETGREALEEMRHLLGVLRASDGGEPADADRPDADPLDPDPLDPQPGLDALDGLVAQVRQAGLTVSLTTSGEPRRLPPAIELSAYRIVQEALTNVLKHAGPARAAVAVGYRDDALVLDVTDDGRGAAAGLDHQPVPGSGHGLVGMRERVALFGGQLSTGPRAGGGFAVRAQIPVQREAS
jgi:signal transduction histidine kinase